MQWMILYGYVNTQLINEFIIPPLPHTHTADEKKVFSPYPICIKNNG